MRVVTRSHAHVAGHAKALLGLAALAAPRGVRRDRAGRAVLALGAVRRGLPAEVVPLHDAGEALALARADHVHELHILEDVHVHRRRPPPGRSCPSAALPGSAASGRRRPWRRARSAAWCCSLRLDVLKAELHRVVAVASRRVLTCVTAHGPACTTVTGHDRALRVVDAGHPESSCQAVLVSLACRLLARQPGVRVMTSRPTHRRPLQRRQYASAEPWPVSGQPGSWMNPTVRQLKQNAPCRQGHVTTNI